ncbi:MAG TPA: bestrophin family ion channel [Ohtaekwangia sp.]|uniref:bestrophin family protein n=1 Tax=Ohtaekwangia sp. TaxID=2066019 RepID=UPI002F920CBC
MLLNKNLRLYRILRITWRVDMIMLASCAAAHYIDIVWLADVDIPAALPALMGTAIAFFIGFNNNQAYGRWWEARIIWGALVNDSRSWARSLLAYCCIPVSGNFRVEDIARYQRTMIYRHIAFLYALKSSLRKRDHEEFEKYLSPEETAHVKTFANIPNAILDLQSRDLQKLSQENVIDGFRFRSFDELIRNFCDSMGRSERINNTVFPTTYIYFTRLFIWMFVILTTMSIAHAVGHWSILLGFMVGFVFHITHINGMNILNPFEHNPSGVPISSITRTIEINLLQALNEKDIPPPLAPIKEEYIL